MAARGRNGAQGGLNKETVGQVMVWAAKNKWVPQRSVWTGKNRLVLRSSSKLRGSMRFYFGKIQREMINEIPENLRNPRLGCM